MNLPARPCDLHDNRLLLIVAFGSVLLWTPEGAVLGVSLFNDGSLAETSYPWFLLAASLTMGMLLLVGALRSPKPRVLLGVGTVGSLLYSAGILLRCFAAVPFPHASLAGSLIAGCGFAALMIAWAAMQVRLPVRVIALAMVLVGVIDLLLLGASALTPLTFIASATFPLASAALLFAANSLLNGDEQADRFPTPTQPPLSIKPAFAAGIGCISLGFGALKMLSFLTPESTMPLAHLLLSTGIILGLLCLTLLGKRGPRYALAWKVIVSALFIGFVILLAAGPSFMDLAFSISQIGYGLFEYLLWVASIDLARRSNMPPLRFIALTFVLTIGGQSLGAFLSIAAFSLAASASTVFVGASLVALLSIAVVWLFPSDALQALFTARKLDSGTSTLAGSDTLDGETAVGSTPAPDFSALAQSYGLTEREAEIARLLAEGRSAKFIGQELFISDSTVWTHIRHIYRKMGVATRQEFISAVRARR